MELATQKHKKGDGIARKYKFDYRSDGKLDITFIRMDKKFKDLHKWANNDITPYLFEKNMRNTKKIYFNFADINSVDGGEAGVGLARYILNSSVSQNDEKKY